MDLKVTLKSDNTITMQKIVYNLVVAPFDSSVRAIRASTITAKGQILVGLAPGIAGALPAGDPGTVLSPTDDPLNPYGYEWITAGGASTEDLSNASGLQLVTGDVVIMSPTVLKQILTTTVKSNLAVQGVVAADIAIGATGPIFVTPGAIIQVNCDSTAINAFDYLITSTTAKLATTNGSARNAACFARALESKGTGNGTIWCRLIEVDIMPIAPEVSGLISWFRPEALAGTAEGALVASWPDVSPANVPAAQSADAYKPYYRGNVLNGYAGLHFDTTAKTMSRWSGVMSPWWTASQSRTIITVSQTANTSGWLWYQGTAPTTVSSRFGLLTGTAADTDGQLLYGSTLLGLTTATSVARIHAATFDGTAVKSYKNNALVGSVNYAVSTGIAQAFVGYVYVGYIFEMLVYGRCLTDAERTACFQYLGTKYGIALS